MRIAIRLDRLDGNLNDMVSKKKKGFQEPTEAYLFQRTALCAFKDLRRNNF